VLGVLRWQRTLDEVVQPLVKRPLHRLDAEVRTVLRMGLFETVHLGVPAPVATDEMIRLTRRLGKGSASGLVNAVLRRATGSTDSLEGAPPDVRWSHPEWLWRRWRDAFGADAADRSMAAAQEPASPWVWFHDPETGPFLEAEDVVLETHPWCPATWSASSNRTALMAAVRRGEAVVQDPSSQLVARLAVTVGGGRGRAVDLCAAPGGKTALMSRLGDWSALAAGDCSLAKAARLGSRLKTVPVVVADAARPAFVGDGWDLVLLDAPCSGTGTLRRHPELKWRLEPDAILAAAAKQRAMVKASLELLARGGTLVYATCSVEPEENERHFAGLPGGFERVVLKEYLPEGLPWSATEAGGVRILPHEFGDGFTVHVVRRRR
jgi:16S rRNA (cytosine967-C5)-methyltransferase